MEKRSNVLIVIALILAALYVSFFTDWFRGDSIQIIVQHRPIPQKLDLKRGTDEVPTFPVLFAFDRGYELTSIRVVKADEAKNQKFPTALWHLVSESNSIPTKALVYGFTPRGMHPAVDDAQPQPLSPGTEYLLEIQAGKLKGTTNFIPQKATIAR